VNLHPTWDLLMASFKNDSSVLVASAQCSGGSHDDRKEGTGASLCRKFNASYYPFLLYGPADNLTAYPPWDLKDLQTLSAVVETRGSSVKPAPNCPAFREEDDCSSHRGCIWCKKFGYCSHVEDIFKPDWCEHDAQSMSNSFELRSQEDVVCLASPLKAYSVMV